mgnify:CR=1 FL=1
MKFAEIKMVTMFELIGVEVGQMIIEESSVKEVKRILELDGKTAEELTAIRNTVVKTLSEEFIEPLIEKEDNIKAMSYMTKLSGITAVIDHELMNMGALY